jgi:hypothetical protein
MLDKPMNDLIKVWPCEHCGADLARRAKSRKPGRFAALLNQCSSCGKLANRLEWFAWSPPAKELIENRLDEAALQKLRLDPVKQIRELNAKIRADGGKEIIFISWCEGRHVALRGSREPNAGQEP